MSERKIYEHLQGNNQEHPNILKYFGRVPSEYELFRGGLVFEYHPLGTLSSFFERDDVTTSFQEESKIWPYQAISAVAFLHSLRVVHWDVGLHNFLVSNDGKMILCDFAGSGMESVLPTIAAGVRYSNPQNDQNEYPTAEDDVFALGTVLFELTVKERLLKGQSSQDIYRHLRDKEFPDLSSIYLPLSEIIQKCWVDRGYKASDALADLQGST